MTKRKITFDYGGFFFMTNMVYSDYYGGDKVEIGKIIGITCDKEVVIIKAP